MIVVSFPEHQFKIKQDNGRQLIFDDVRKQWLVLTPEEWVRQNLLQYLMKVKGYPRSLIAVEREIVLGELKKRCDIVVYKQAEPWMIVECKEMDVKLSEAVLKQILNYNITLKVKYLVISNGRETFVLSIKGEHIEWLPEFPDYK